MIADEQFVDDELDLLGVEVDVAAPPALETQIAFGFRVDLRIQTVLLAPQRIRRVQIFEILHQPGAVEFSGSEIAGQRCQPAAA